MLTGKQKRFLRAKANEIKPIFQVGKTGVHANMITQMNEALERREIIKVSVLQNCLEDKHDVAKEIAEKTGAHIVQVIGNQITFYKRSIKHQQIELP